MVSSLGLFSVLLPPDSEKRSAILLTNVYTFIILESLVANSAPKTDTVPLLGEYIICALALVTLQLLGTYIVLVLAAHAATCEPVATAAEPTASTKNWSMKTREGLLHRKVSTLSAQVYAEQQTSKPPLLLRAIVVWPSHTLIRAVTKLFWFLSSKLMCTQRARERQRSTQTRTESTSGFNQKQRRSGAIVALNPPTEQQLIDLCTSTFPERSVNNRTAGAEASKSINHTDSRNREKRLEVRFRGHEEVHLMDSFNSCVDHMDQPINSIDPPQSGAVVPGSSAECATDAYSRESISMQELSQQPFATQQQSKLCATEPRSTAAEKPAEGSWREIVYFLNLQLCTVYLILNAIIFWMYLVPLLGAWSSNARVDVYYYDAGIISKNSDEA